MIKLLIYINFSHKLCEIFEEKLLILQTFYEVNI